MNKAEQIKRIVASECKNIGLILDSKDLLMSQKTAEEHYIKGNAFDDSIHLGVAEARLYAKNKNSTINC